MTITTRAPHRLRALTTGLAVALALGAAPFAAEAEAAEQQIFDVGHVDAFNVHVADGKLELDLKEDITGSHVHRDPADVELHVKSAALTDLPDHIPGAPQGYYLPLVQDHQLLWPGWDTLGIQGSDFDPSVDLEFTSVQGPGDVHLFGAGALGSIAPLLEGGSMELVSGAVRRQSFPAHTHANWIFGEPGVYKISLRAIGVRAGVQEATEVET